MNWTYLIKEKIKIALALAVVFVLVLCTNLLDKRRFSELHHTIKSVHKDRLLVENYVFNIAQSLKSKQIDLYELSFNPSSLWPASFKKNNTIISLNINDFQQTVLTHEEDALLQSLGKELFHLETMEANFLMSKNDNASLMLEAITRQHERINSNLTRLSAIQLEEGKKLLGESNDIISISNLTSRIELGLLIVFGLLIQGIIFSSKSLQPKFPQQANLN